MSGRPTAGLPPIDRLDSTTSKNSMGVGDVREREEREAQAALLDATNAQPEQSDASNEDYPALSSALTFKSKRDYMNHALKIKAKSALKALFPLSRSQVTKTYSQFLRSEDVPDIIMADKTAIRQIIGEYRQVFGTVRVRCRTGPS